MKIVRYPVSAEILPDVVFLEAFNHLDADNTIAVLSTNQRLRRLGIQHLKRTNHVWSRAVQWLTDHTDQMPTSRFAQIMCIFSRKQKLSVRWPLELYFQQRQQRMHGSVGDNVNLLLARMARPFRVDQLESFMDAFYMLFDYLIDVLLMAETRRRQLDTCSWRTNTTMNTLFHHERTLDKNTANKIKGIISERSSLLSASELAPLRRAFATVCTYEYMVPTLTKLRVYCTDSRLLIDQILPFFESLRYLQVHNVDSVDMKRMLLLAKRTPSLAHIEIHGRSHHDPVCNKLDNVRCRTLHKGMVRTLKTLTLVGCHFLDDDYLRFIVRRTFNLMQVQLYRNPHVTEVGNSLMMEELNRQKPYAYTFTWGCNEPSVDEALEGLQWALTGVAAAAPIAVPNVKAAPIAVPNVKAAPIAVPNVGQAIASPNVEQNAANRVKKEAELRHVQIPIIVLPIVIHLAIPLVLLSIVLFKLNTC